MEAAENTRRSCHIRYSGYLAHPDPIFAHHRGCAAVSARDDSATRRLIVPKADTEVDHDAVIVGEPHLKGCSLAALGLDGRRALARQYRGVLTFTDSIDGCATPALSTPADTTRLHQTARSPNPTGFLRVHGLAFGTFKRLAELFEVLHGAVDAPSSRCVRVG